jgi:glutathione synthase/RimK-type ligase-like ATP-grasp enzyme
MRLGLITCERLPNLYGIDVDMIPIFETYGITAYPAVWSDDSINWSSFDGLLIRSPWDYFERYQAFSNWLNTIISLNVPLYNSAATLLLNIDKIYLKLLTQNGLPIIPTIFSKAPDLEKVLENCNWDEMVIKPSVSGGSYLTERFDASRRNEIITWAADQDRSLTWLVQPFIPEIISHGEVSILFFDGEFSHGVIKTPKDGDYRIQSQFGGLYQKYDPSPDDIDMSLKALHSLDPDFLYGRVDMVPIDGVMHIMEVEMIEPDLYFSVYPDKLPIFVNKVIQRIKKG